MKINNLAVDLPALEPRLKLLGTVGDLVIFTSELIPIEIIRILYKKTESPGSNLPNLKWWNTFISTDQFSGMVFSKTDYELFMRANNITTLPVVRDKTVNVVLVMTSKGAENASAFL